MGLFQAALLCLDRRRPAVFTALLSDSQIDEMKNGLIHMQDYAKSLKIRSPASRNWRMKMMTCGRSFALCERAT